MPRQDRYPRCRAVQLCPRGRQAIRPVQDQERQRQRGRRAKRQGELSTALILLFWSRKAHIQLEELERKYAHLGYQDIFYLTRLQLGLPPSTLDLGRPTSPCRKVLVRAKFPLDPKYQLPLEDPSTTRLSAAMSRSGGGASSSGSTSQQGAGYAESSRSAASGSKTALGGPDVFRRPLMDREDSRGRSRERRDTNMRSPALGPTPMIVVPTPPEGRRESETLPRTPEALPIPGRSPLHQAETRDLFDHSVDLGTPLPPPFLGGHGRPQDPPLPMPQREARDEHVQEDDVDVRRMLEARIQALVRPHLCQRCI